MQNLLRKLWFKLNKHYCMVNAYLAQERGRLLLQADWELLAGEWDSQIWGLR